MPFCTVVPNIDRFYRSTDNVCFFESIRNVLAKISTGKLRYELGGATFEICLGIVHQSCRPLQLTYSMRAPTFTGSVMAEGTVISIERAFDAINWMGSDGAKAFGAHILPHMLRQRLETQLRVRYNLWVMEPSLHEAELLADRTFLPAVPSPSDLSPAYTPKMPLRRLSNSTRRLEIPEPGMSSYDRLMDIYNRQNHGHCLDIISPTHSQSTGSLPSTLSPSGSIATLQRSHSTDCEPSGFIFNFEKESEQSVDLDGSEVIVVKCSSSKRQRIASDTSIINTQLMIVNEKD